MSSITTHILDTARGVPAADVSVVLHLLEKGGSREIGAGRTDQDGRLRSLIALPQELQRGTYRLTFDVGDYFRRQGVASFYAEVVISFVVGDPAAHYHVPLLLSPFGYSTYRGS